MKTETKNLDKCQVQLTVTLDANEANAVVKDVEKRFVREAAVPGFRPGKAPLALLRKNYGGELEKRIAEGIANKNIPNAIKEAKLEDQFLAVYMLDDVKHDEKGATLVFTIEVKPTFKVPTYKGLKIAFNDVTVKDEDVQAQIDNLRGACAKFEDAKEDTKVKEGDFIQIDFTGTIDGKPISEFDEKAKVISEGQGFWTQVLDDRFVPEVIKALKGMKVGETKKDIKAKFAKGYDIKALEGKKALYTVTVKSIRSRVLPDDATFLEQLKPQFNDAAESMEKLTSYIREQMQRAEDSREATRRENEAAEMLLKKVDFDLPIVNVKNAMKNYLSDLAERAQYSGLGADYFKKNRDTILKEAKEYAEKQVRLHYVLSAIADAEKLENDKDENGETRTRKALKFVLDQAKK